MDVVQKNKSIWILSRCGSDLKDTVEDITGCDSQTTVKKVKKCIQWNESFQMDADRNEMPEGSLIMIILRKFCSLIYSKTVETKKAI
jgi:hypothetical protein